jgi:hypothetical protein
MVSDGLPKCRTEVTQSQPERRTRLNYQNANDIDRPVFMGDVRLDLGHRHCRLRAAALFAAICRRGYPPACVSACELGSTAVPCDAP